MLLFRNAAHHPNTSRHSCHVGWRNKLAFIFREAIPPADHGSLSSRDRHAAGLILGVLAAISLIDAALIWLQLT